MISQVEKHDSGINFKPSIINNIRRFFGNLFATDNYINTLSQEQILDKGMDERSRAKYEMAKRDCKDSIRCLLERGESYSEKLGEQFKGRLRAEIVQESVRKI